MEGRLDRAHAFPLHGFTVYEDHKKDASGAAISRAAAYRWHVADPVPWESAIRAEIEHGGENDKEADYRSATWWYDGEPAIGKD